MEVKGKYGGKKITKIRTNMPLDVGLNTGFPHTVCILVGNHTEHQNSLMSTC